MLEADLITHVEADEEVTALIGEAEACRFYPLVAPAGAAFPHCIFARTDTPERVQSQDGPSDYAKAEIEIEAWSPKYLEACEVMEEMRKCLDAFRDSTGATVIQNIEAEGPHDIYAEAPQFLYGRGMKFLIQYTED